MEKVKRDRSRGASSRESGWGSEVNDDRLSLREIGKVRR